MYVKGSFRMSMENCVANYSDVSKRVSHSLWNQKVRCAIDSMTQVLMFWVIEHTFEASFSNY